MRLLLFFLAASIFLFLQINSGFIFAEARANQADNMDTNNFFSDDNAPLNSDEGTLDAEFEDKFNNIFKTIENAQQSKQDTELGPLGRYILGRNLAARVLTAYDVSSDSETRLQYLTEIVASLMASSRHPDTYKKPVVILLEEPDTVNAFAAPGGFVFVTTGMLNFIENEDELAFVLAHEIAHIELDHGLNAIKQNEGSKIFTDATNDGSEAFFGAFQNFAENGYSTKLESEADIRGAEIASNLGYDIAQGIKVIQRLEKVTGRAHGTGYPQDRKLNLERNVATVKVKNEFIAFRKRRYQSAILE